MVRVCVCVCVCVQGVHLRWYYPFSCNLPLLLDSNHGMSSSISIMLSRDSEKTKKDQLY